MTPMAAASAWGQLCATIYYFSNQEIRVKLASNTAGFRSGPQKGYYQYPLLHRSQS
jgi:hypothetical protein